MESATKKVSNILRNTVWWADYILFHSINFWRMRKPPRTVKKILVIELLFVGDTLVITPALRALKERFPDAEITAMLLKGFEDVIFGNPNISRIISFTKEEIHDNISMIAKTLQNDGYDLAVIFHPGSWDISQIIKRANIPYRIGCTRVGFLEGKGFFLNRKTRPTFRWKHKVEDNLDVLKTIGINAKNKHLEAHTTKESDKAIKDKFKKNGISRYFVIHAAPQHSTHEWLPERFAKTADILTEKTGHSVIFTGTDKDRPYNEKIISMMKQKALNASGTTIKEFFSIIKNSEFVISVDTSAMHVAAAFDRPTVSLFGAGNPKIWHPYCRNYRAIFKKDKCTSCMKHKCVLKGKRRMECMKSISIDDVINAVETVTANPQII